MNYKKKYLKYKLKYLNLKKKMKGGEGFFEAVQNLGEKVSNSCSTVCELKKEFKELGEGCFKVCETALRTVVDKQTARVVAEAAADAAVGAAVGAVEETLSNTKRMGNFAVGVLTGLTAEQWLILKKLYDSDRANFFNKLTEFFADEGASFAFGEGIKQQLINLSKQDWADFMEKLMNMAG